MADKGDKPDLTRDNRDSQQVPESQNTAQEPPASTATPKRSAANVQESSNRAKPKQEYADRRVDDYYPSRPHDRRHNSERDSPDRLAPITQYHKPGPGPYSYFGEHPVGAQGGYNYYDRLFGRGYEEARDRPVDRGLEAERRYLMDRERDEYSRRQKEEFYRRERINREQEDLNREIVRDQKLRQQKDYDWAKDQDFGEFDLQRREKEENRFYGSNRDFDKYRDFEDSQALIYKDPYASGYISGMPALPSPYRGPQYLPPGPYNIMPMAPAFHHLPYPSPQYQPPSHQPHHYQPEQHQAHHYQPHQYMPPQMAFPHLSQQQLNPESVPLWLLAALSTPMLDRRHAPVLLHHGSRPVLLPAPNVCLAHRDGPLFQQPWMHSH